MQNVLTREEVQYRAPSVFSTERKPGLSNRYQPYCTWDLLKDVREDGWQIVDAGQSSAREPENRFFKRHLLRLSRPDLEVSEEFRIDVLLSNGNDGQNSLRVELGTYRFVCANGTVSGQEYDAVAIRHIYAPEKVQQACEEIAGRAPQIAEHIEDWKGLRLSMDQERSFVNYAKQLRFGRVNDTPDLNIVRRSDDRGADLWHTFQRLQEGCLRGGQAFQTPSGRISKTREIRSIGTNLRLNRRLWSAAETIYNGGDLVLPA